MALQMSSVLPGSTLYPSSYYRKVPVEQNICKSARQIKDMDMELELGIRLLLQYAQITGALKNPLLPDL